MDNHAGAMNGQPVQAPGPARLGGETRAKTAPTLHTSPAAVNTQASLAEQIVGPSPGRPHTAPGEWLPWVEANLEFERGQASRYMRVYENRANVSLETHLTFSEAYRLLSQPAGEPQAAQETEQKARLKHGEWLPWVEGNLEFDRMTAWRYINLFTNRAKCNTVLHLSISEAYRLLSQPAGEPQAAQETEQKARLKHGEWLPWVEGNLEFDDRTVRRYVNLFENRIKLDTVSDLGITEAYRLLSQPAGEPQAAQEPPEPQDEAQQATQAGCEVYFKSNLLGCRIMKYPKGNP